MNKTMHFVMDVVMAFGRFNMEALRIVVNMIMFITALVCHVTNWAWVQVVMPMVHHAYEFMDFALNFMYEEVLWMVYVMCIRVAGLLLKMGKSCQNLMVCHQRHRRWL
jgi:hypothetical protein